MAAATSRLGNLVSATSFVAEDGGGGSNVSVNSSTGTSTLDDGTLSLLLLFYYSAFSLH